MTGMTTTANVSRIFLIAVIALLAFSPVSKADNPSDSINTIQEILPDSISLDGKVVYVDFWASWCAPCRQSFPWMQEMYKKYKDKGFEIVAVSVDKNHDLASKFIESNKPDFPIVFDSTGALAKKYRLEAMPSSYIYNSKGQIYLLTQGFQKDDSESIEETINKLLKERSEK